eukprot:7165480-Alexandrium_andersonii.AAC.1
MPASPAARTRVRVSPTGAALIWRSGRNENARNAPSCAVGARAMRSAPSPEPLPYARVAGASA